MALGEAGPFAAAAAYSAAAYSIVAGVGGVPPGAAALAPLAPPLGAAAAAASGKQAPSDGKRGRRGDGPLDDFPLNKGSGGKKRGTLKVPPLAATGADDEATEPLLGVGAYQNGLDNSTEAVGINEPGATGSRTPQRGAGAGAAAADDAGRGYPSTPPRSGGGGSGIERQVSERTLAAIAAAEVRAARGGWRGPGAINLSTVPCPCPCSAARITGTARPTVAWTRTRPATSPSACAREGGREGGTTALWPLPLELRPSPRIAGLRA